MFNLYERLTWVQNQVIGEVIFVLVEACAPIHKDGDHSLIIKLNTDAKAVLTVVVFMLLCLFYIFYYYYYY